MRNLKLTIAFDGTDYSGWQRQLNAPTIQGELEKVLGTITNSPVILHGAGRTDAGVHALAMVANFVTESSIDREKLLTGANCLLPPAIRILEIKTVAPDFHSRFSTSRKSYIYAIDTSPVQSPITRLYAVHIPQTLNLHKMRECLTMITGSHDFASFEASGSRDKSILSGRGSVRTLYQATLTETGNNSFEFELCGDGFLRHMVRNIVGTVLEVGKGRKSIEEFLKILGARDRSKASATAPAHGLFLKVIQYE